MLLIKMSISSFDHIPCFHLWPENRNDKLITEVKVRKKNTRKIRPSIAINKESRNFSYLNELELILNRCYFRTDKQSLVTVNSCLNNVSQTPLQKNQFFFETEHGFLYVLSSHIFRLSLQPQLENLGL